MKINCKILYAALFLLPVLFFSCEEKPADVQSRIIGAWQLTSIEIDGSEMEISGPPDIIRFNSNHIFESKNSSTNETIKGGWSYEGDMLNISIYLPAAFYVLKADTQTLSLKRLDFNSEGKLSATIQNYKSITNYELQTTE